MSKAANSKMPSSAADLAANTANLLPLDSAARVVLKPGLEGRYGLCPLTALQNNPHAVRVHPKRQLDMLARSMEVIGPLAPVVIDERFVILAGHARVLAAKRSGASTIPVVQTFGLSEARKRAYLLADNQSAEGARLDREKLALQLPELTLLLEEDGLELTDTCYELAELDELIDDFEQESSDPTDEIDASITEDRVSLRDWDVMLLGTHRLAVGDARDHALLDKLMGDQHAEAAFLDVPYNLKVAQIGGRGRIKHPEFAFASGEMSDEQFVEFLEAALTNAARVSQDGAVHFVCTDWRHVAELKQASKKIYGAQLNLVVWNKTNAGQGAPYRSQHELIGVFRVGDSSHIDNVQQGRFKRNRSNVWSYPGVNTFRAGRLEELALHPTVKPVQLVADALKDVTSRGGVVLDTFVGSGTTILAGEKVGRKIRAIEIEPHYAQIAVRRWERQTGRQAMHEETGMTFDELLEARGAASKEPPRQDCLDAAQPADTFPRPRIRTRFQP